MPETEGRDPISIRRGVVTDAAALARLARDTFVSTYGAQNRPEDMAAHVAGAFGTDRQAAELARDDMVTLLAQQGTDLVGFAQVQRRAPPAGTAPDDAFELHRFYLTLAVQGQGVADRLMRGVRDAARAVGARALWLSVWERNARALRFYARSGFVDVGSTHFDVGPDRQTDRVLCAELAAQ